MRNARSVRAVAALAAAGLSLTACGNLDDNGTSGGTGDTITVGFVTPLTGSLAAFGEPDKWVVDQMTTWFAQHPIEAGGKKYKVKIILRDSQSDAKRASEVASELITKDHATVLLSHATPETTVPVADQCEANATLCITADTPWQPWYFRHGEQKEPFKHTYHFFWGLEDVASVYSDMWGQTPTNKKVAALFPNDSDGQAWSDKAKGFPALVKDLGYTIDNPGLFPSGTQDFSAQIAQFKKNGDEILMGVLTPPDFATFWKQAKQQGFTPKVVTIGKAAEFPAAINGFGALAENLGTEVWWSPNHPFSSGLTGQSSAQLAATYTKATNKQWSMPLGFSEALFEVLQAAVVKAGTADGAKLAEAMRTLKVSTIVGELNWASGPVPNVAKSPLVGGQWRASKGGPFPFEMNVVSNSTASQIPTVGKVVPLG